MTVPFVAKIHLSCQNITSHDHQFSKQGSRRIIEKVRKKERRHYLLLHETDMYIFILPGTRASVVQTVSGQKMETAQLASKSTAMSVKAKSTRLIPPKYQVPLEGPRVPLEPEQDLTKALAVPPTISRHGFGTSNLSSLV